MEYRPHRCRCITPGIEGESGPTGHLIDELAMWETVRRIIINAQWLAQKVDEKGGRVRVIYYDKVDHYRIIGGMSRVLRGWAPTLEDVVTFIGKRQ